MPKSKVLFVCSECGGEHLRWQGQCQFCREWNTLKEISNQGSVNRGEAKKPKKLSEISQTSVLRLLTDIGEFDRVLGEGIVPGSAVLLSGPPGIGKSTLLLQVAEKIGQKSPVVYVSGEESEEQIAGRAERLGIAADNLYFLAQTDLELILSELSEMSKLGLVVVDSLQTTTSENVTGSSGSPSQLKYAAAQLTNFAKAQNVPVIMTGHVTKTFAIGGPKFLEHIVDVVLAFEGDKFSSLRVLRSQKNRFGATSEVGIFEMGKKGLEEVTDPSAAFLKHHRSSPGSALMVALEGTRPLLLEIQALTSSTSYAYPKRTTQGIASKRALLILAVLEKYGRISLSRSDIFIKSSLGMRVFEPAADLAIAVAVASARLKKPIPPKLCFFGEVGLNGQIKFVTGEEERRKHAKKLGLEAVGADEYPTVTELLASLFSA
ncbi:DNA repair protein RadA [candidate division WWE3 bacterium RBG_19FT_COMBO_53_11]|uniref:DNA repair protein RadA n=1 Tax=candidate division WWE3 bacterium RBG_19FT_COMBO_53_11 TaxID=1802613 RepID=A0A1F4UJ32_UNCKA|nr:MAG: DNA repair protein RadA [candidate division WWE3 bacterium RBG_16_52_45]OGC44975.1 MAG: DNA repair protein RadA [candidate division WWE3 bacterium RBG_19FT_COMBO_53_11]